MEELKSMLHQLIEDTKKLTAETRDLRKANNEIRRVARRSRTTARVLAGVVVFVIAIGAAGWIQLTGVANCTNTNLGQRAAPTKADAEAHIRQARSQQALAHANAVVAAALVQSINARTDDEKQAATGAFVRAFLAQQPVAVAASKETDAYVKQLEADQAARAARPLGKC